MGIRSPKENDFRAKAGVAEQARADIRASARRSIRASASERELKAGIAKGLPKPLGRVFGGFLREQKATRARRRETLLTERCRFATIQTRSLSRLAATAPFRKGSRRVGLTSGEDRSGDNGFPRPPVAASE